MRKEKNKKRSYIIPIIAFVIFTIFLVCFIYINDYYRADESAYEYINSPAETITVKITSETIEFVPDTIEAGLIFYPGGKVQFEAYAPLLSELAQNNILCVLVHMPANLAVLNSNAADSVIEKHPEVTKWYIAGHSLGGAMAANYVASNTDGFEGLILLAAYSTVDLSASGLKVLSIYGSNDGVLNMEKYNETVSNLPKDATFHIIDGGCHAMFGAYGEQKGDGIPAISFAEQTEETVNEITDLIFKE